jgi:hypothetical protein
MSLSSHSRVLLTEAVHGSHSLDRSVRTRRDGVACVWADTRGPAVHLWTGRARRRELVLSTGGQGVAYPTDTKGPAAISSGALALS